MSRRSMLILIILAAAVAVWAIAHVISEARAASLCDHLWSCAEEGQNDCVRDALRQGADPNGQGGEPIRRARLYGHADTVAILRKAGAR